MLKSDVNKLKKKKALCEAYQCEILFSCGILDRMEHRLHPVVFLQNALVLSSSGHVLFTNQGVEQTFVAKL